MNEAENCSLREVMTGEGRALRRVIDGRSDFFIIFI